MMKNHGSIEKILETINTDSKLRKKHHIPDPFLYEEARELFKNHDVRKAEEIKFKWQPVNEKALFEFLVHEKKFLDKRVEEGIKKIKRHKDKPNQTRLDGFFKKPTAPKPEAKKVSPKEKVQSKIDIPKKRKASAKGTFKKRKKVVEEDEDEEPTADM